MPLHKVALFLNPKFKSMAALGNPEREEVIALIKCLLQIMPACIQRNDRTYAPPPSKIPRQFSIDDEFDEWQDISGTRSDEHEVDTYKTIVFEQSDTNKLLGETRELELELEQCLYERKVSQIELHCLGCAFHPSIQCF